MSCKVLSTLTIDGFEKFFCARGSWTTIAHVAHLSGNHSTLIEKASHVIQCLLKRHSRMRTRLRVDGDEYLLDILEYNSEYLSSSLFFSTVEATYHSWQEIVEQRCNQDPYSNNGTMIFPLFHFMLLFNSPQSNDNFFHFILFENHCASDGRSGYILINDFLTLVTDPNLFSKSEPVNNEILPSINQMIRRPFGSLFPLALFIVKQIFKYELRQLRHPRIPVTAIPHLHCGPSKFLVQRYRVKFLFASSSSDLYVNLHEQCHLHNMTLNGPLFACLLLAIHQFFPFVNNTRLKPFGIGVNFDMRSRLVRSPLTSSSVGFFVGIGEVKFNRSFSIRSTRFWSLAHRCMMITRNQLNRIGVPLITNMFTDISRHEHEFNRFNRLFYEGRQSEFAFSNIGKYPFSCEYNCGEIQLQGLHVINNGSIYRSSTVMYVTCVGDGQLDISLAHDMESDEKAKEFLNCYVHLIEACADRTHCNIETTLDQLLKSIN
ncbi:unnamed protein product [Rotaria sp. Silwood2]|nr:unnamed protein product [Rotaria sp. Silwood2]CAF2877585.1 unnamed protein product [Rotaria sp. Silwood2]CAF3359795.1 unnamed protein product [Rotaria sp. Silwood2]CAF4000489.1 unnamed protein product [Rotaria sp. Silwood2]CAF4000579.1 unnamed protein product [Rotaria sp. Silwood2]